jgi:hypothetical protein
LKKGAPKTSVTFLPEVQRPREIVKKSFCGVQAASLFSKSYSSLLQLWPKLLSLRRNHHQRLMASGNPTLVHKMHEPG